MPSHLFLAAALLTAAPSALAWGPHMEITRAALDVLPDGDKVRKYLGDDFGRLARDYCWMGDWQEAVRPDHFADDYLIFPGSPRHVSHMHPNVRQTYRPFFRRALQAVRTESPREAARWIGSLMHFVQDAGSPPHTTGIGGTLHGKMERWVDESKISIAGYIPRLLGKSDDEALKAFEERMAGLHDFARVRAEKLRPLVEKLEARENQPLELECALEVSRVTADIVHTLLTLGRREPMVAGARLEGKLAYAPPAGYAAVPAKVVIEETDFSTTTDPEGGYRFRNLPPGKYVVRVLAVGYQTERIDDVMLTGGKVTTVATKLKADPVPGNLVRNPDFRLRWASADRPDGWAPDSVKPGRWAGAPIRVPVGQPCSVRVEFPPAGKVPVSVRWRSNPSSPGGGREVAMDIAKQPVEVTPPDQAPFEKGFLFLELILHTDRQPGDVFRYVAVTFVRK